ncbi:protein CYSTEINE-RICH TRANSMEMBRANE MODULE 11 isoform X2 [Amaranthus tricolor]|uniref:protein CYSTEINE-RICH TRANSMEMBRANE MODULE 11 isoform X2 n=1 Tax=Amaranthus tricolor TaxID=29722 RepID=UPI00258D3A0A|nr:protein CYSTEINE-RICH TRANSMEMBRANE MODULE 11 isoform X2 [Amaranthus tricolor]
MSDPKYAYPAYPAQGYYQGPPVMAPPQYPQQYQYAQPPPPQQPVQKERGFLEGCLAALCCCFLVDECCCDPTIICVD